MDIYKATNKINGKSYVGYAVYGMEDRKGDHESDASREDGYYFQHAIKKYGEHNFSWITLENGVTDFQILEELERYWIREFQTKHPYGYNLTDGGRGTYGYKHTEETRRKMSEAAKNRRV